MTEWTTIREQLVRGTPPYRDWWVVEVQRFGKGEHYYRNTLRVGAHAVLDPMVCLSWRNATSVQKANESVRNLCRILGGHCWGGRWVIDTPGLDLADYEQAPFYGPLLPGVDAFMISPPGER